MTATDGYPQNSNTNPEGHTPMNTTTRTATRYLNIDLLNMADLGPTLMPGDTIHVEATLVVRSVTNGLDWRGNPTETVSAKPADSDGQQVVVRTAHMQVIDGRAWDGETGDGPTDPELEPARPSWLKRHMLDLKIGGGILGFMLWVAGIAVLAVLLTSCAAPATTPTPKPSPAPTPSSSSSPSLNPEHVAICHTFKAKADDPTRSPAIRASNLAEYNARCQDVKAAEAKG